LAAAAGARQTTAAALCQHPARLPHAAPLHAATERAHARSSSACRPVDTLPCQPSLLARPGSQSGVGAIGEHGDGIGARDFPGQPHADQASKRWARQSPEPSPDRPCQRPCLRPHTGDHGMLSPAALFVLRRRVLIRRSRSGAPRSARGKTSHALESTPRPYPNPKVSWQRTATVPAWRVPRCRDVGMQAGLRFGHGDSSPNQGQGAHRSPAASLRGAGVVLNVIAPNHQDPGVVSNTGFAAVSISGQGGCPAAALSCRALPQQGSQACLHARPLAFAERIRRRLQGEVERHAAALSAC